MKPLTKKERRGTYLKAAKYLFAYHASNICICPSISVICDGTMYNYQTEELMQRFEEFALFEPPSKERRWFNGGDEKGDRITALLLMSEMCKP